MNILKFISMIYCLFLTSQLSFAQELQLHICGDINTGGVLIDNVRGDGITRKIKPSAIHLLNRLI